MNPEEAPCSVARRTDIPASRCVREDASAANDPSSLRGGVFSDTKLAWLSRGPLLEIINTKDGSKVAGWTFGAVIKDLSTKITSVIEYKRPALDRLPQPLTQVLVGLECEFTGGMVCVFNFPGPRVLRAINIPSKVTSLSLISRGMETTSLHSCLESMDGIVSVGTKDGHIFIIDLRRSHCEKDLSTGLSSCWENVHDELRSCQLLPVRGVVVDQRMKDFPNDHLCLHLNRSAFSDFKKFVVQFPRGDYKQYLPEDPAVTSMLYVPCLSSLIVGFAFGSFQIWSLKTLNLLYTCPMGGGPVEHLTFQEACDDPNACCYLWVVRGASGEPSPELSDLPSVIMYTLCFDEKLWVHECGNVFNNFVSCNIAFRFELDLEDGIAGGRVISMRTIDQALSPFSSPSFLTDDNSAVGSSAGSLSLCLLVWETWGSAGPQEGLDPSNTHMAIFDLNQWYVDHMPSRLSSRGGLSRNKMIAGYVAKYRLGEALCGDGDVADGLFCGILLDACVDPNSLLPFTTVQNVEEHSRPSALQFQTVALIEKQLVHLQHPGIQRALLTSITSAGPSILLTPTYVFHQCLALGLRLLQHDMPDTLNVEMAEQRSYVVAVALEQRLVRWLSGCARQCSDGRLEGAGCTLAWFLNVLWSRATDLKRTASQLCVQLFDHSGDTLDGNASRQLRHIVAVFHVLETLFGVVIKEGWHLRLIDSHHTELQKQALQMEVQYYKVLQWLLGVGLLPELPDSPESPDTPESGHVPYPAKDLVELYSARRTELQELYKTLEEQEEELDPKEQAFRAPPPDLLMIDGLIHYQAGGSRLQREWERDAVSIGGAYPSFYPPASIQALLRTYLIPGIDYNIKTSIVIYVFMDLAATLDQEKWSGALHRFMQFPSAFKMSPGLIKLTQAFWHLDHKAFEVALEMLLDPLVSNLDMEPWQHRSVIRALMLQGQHKLAQRYIWTRKPALNTEQDVRIKLSLLLANDLVHEAFMFQRNHSNLVDSQSLLRHFFRGCVERNLLSSILQLSLSEKEEEAFLSFLASSKNPVADDAYIMYLLKRSRYVEAFEVNQRLRKAALESGRSTSTFDDEHGTTREIVVTALFKTLPGVTRALAAHCAQERNKMDSWKQVSRPTPISVEVRQCQADARYKSSFMETALAKTRETWAKVLPKHENTTDARASFVENTPFLCTPRAKIERTVRSLGKSRSFKLSELSSRKRSRDEDGEGGTPASKLQRSADLTSVSHQLLDAAVNGSAGGLFTPTVKRQSPKSRLASSTDARRSQLTPQSIIKSRDSLNLSAKSAIFLRRDSSAITGRSSSNKSEWQSLAKSVLPLPETPENIRRLSTRTPRVPLTLEAELTDDEEEVSLREKSTNMSSDRSGNDSLISTDLDSEDEKEKEQPAFDFSFSLPSKSPSPVKAPAQPKKVSLSNMVVLSEARKVGFMTKSRKSLHASRSSVTFGEDSVCVYDKDEPASTATCAPESAQEEKDEKAQHAKEEEESQESTSCEEPDGDVNLPSTSSGKQIRKSIRTESEEVSEDLASDKTLSDVRKSCHRRVKPRSPVHPEIRSGLEDDDNDEAAPKEDVDGRAKDLHAGTDFDLEVSPGINMAQQWPPPSQDLTSAVVEEVAGPNDKLERNVEEAEVTDDDSNDYAEGLEHQETSPPEVQEDVDHRCALLSPGFRNRLVRKPIHPSKEESLAAFEAASAKATAAAATARRAAMAATSYVMLEPQVATVYAVEADSPEPEGESDEAREALGDPSAADALLSDDLDSEEEQEEESKVSTFWSLFMPSPSSPGRTSILQRQVSLPKAVVLSEARKASYARAKPRRPRFSELRDKDTGEDARPALHKDAEASISASSSEAAEALSEEGRKGEQSDVEEANVQVRRPQRPGTPAGKDDLETAQTGDVTSLRTTTSSRSTEVASSSESHSTPKSGGDSEKDVETVEEISGDSSGEVEQRLTKKLTRPPPLQSEAQGLEEASVQSIDGETDEEYEYRVSEVKPIAEELEDEGEFERRACEIIESGSTPLDEYDSGEEMEALRMEESDAEEEEKTNQKSEPAAALAAKPITPPNVNVSVARPSTPLKTPRSTKLPVRGSATPMSAKTILRRTRLNESAIFSGTKTRARDVNVSRHSPQPGKRSPTLPREKPKPTAVKEPIVTKKREPSLHACADLDEVGESSGRVDPKGSLHRRTRRTSTLEDVEMQDSTPRRTRGASVREVEVKESTPPRSRVAKDVQVTPRRTRGSSVVADAEVRESTPSRTRTVGLVKEDDVQESTPRRTKGSTVAKDVEAKDHAARHTSGSSVAKEDEVQESTKSCSEAKEDEIQESTSRRTSSPSAAEEDEVQESTRSYSEAKEDEIQENSSRRTKGSSVAKDVEAKEQTPRRTRGSSVAKEDEVTESTPRATRASSVTKDVQHKESGARPSRGSSALREIEEERSPTHRTRGSSGLKEVEDESLTPESVRSTRSRGSVEKAKEESKSIRDHSAKEAGSPPRTGRPRSSEKTDEISPRETRSSSSLKQSEDESISPRETRSSSQSNKEEKPATPSTTRKTRAAKETSALSSSVVKEEAEPRTPRRTRRSSAISEKEEEVLTPRQQRRGVASSPARGKKAEEAETPETTSARRTKQGATPRTRRASQSILELDDTALQREIDDESSFSGKAKDASPLKTPESAAPRTPSRRSSVSSLGSERRSSKTKSETDTQRSTINDSSLILQEKLARISPSSGSDSSFKRSRSSHPATPLPKKRRASSLSGSVYSDFTEPAEHGPDRSSEAKRIGVETIAEEDGGSEDTSSRDKIEAAIQEYSSTRRLTRKQHAMLSRSLEVSAHAERFHQSKMQTFQTEEEDDDDDDEGMSVHGDAMSQSSVRSSLRLRNRREADRQSSPTSTATTEILVSTESPRTSARLRGRPRSLVDSPSSVASNASRRRTRRTSIDSKAEKDIVPEPASSRVVSSNSEVESSSQTSSRKRGTGSTRRSFSSDVDAPVFSVPDGPDDDAVSLSEVSSAYRESFMFSPPQSVEVQHSESSEASTRSKRSTRQTKSAAPSTLKPISEESQQSSKVDRDESSSSSRSNEKQAKRRSWHVIPPLTEEELATAAKYQRQKKRAKKVITYPAKRRSEFLAKLAQHKHLLKKDDSDE